MIIGLTGLNGSGKGEVARFLEDRGFQVYSLSDVVREELRSRRIEITRDSLIVMGNELRARYGPGILAERILERLQVDKNYAIDSIRSPFEVEALRRRPDFVLLFVSAPLEIRFRRVQKRGRSDDPKTLEDFIRTEELELESRDPSSQQLVQTYGLADFKTENGGTLEELHEKLKELLLQISQRLSRPNWDEYFMSIARVVALRSNCVKRKVAAVIVKDRRIISTGYNGTPRGVRNCNEGGCPRCNSFVSQGEKLEECLCSHAEENAITQAAYHGVNIKDSILYTTYSPCLMCTKMVINGGITEVVYSADYTLDELPKQLLAEARIKLRQVTAETASALGSRPLA